jgi:hypothetical protein
MQVQNKWRETDLSDQQRVSASGRTDSLARRLGVLLDDLMEHWQEKTVMSPERFLTLSNAISLFRASMAAPIIILLDRNQMVSV